ncbi:MAG: hypothetical protein S4CHLAM102_04090 [Chlamydiia bacterium]|nr:hypothetical protein [Chlamydiia bacterium]
MNSETTVFSSFSDILTHYQKKECFSPKIFEICKGFYEAYRQVLKHLGRHESDYLDVCANHMQYIEKQIVTPYQFEPYHHAIRDPDYYQFGIDCISGLVDQETSTVGGKENLEKIVEYLKKGENVIFFANHQIEADPQCLAILLRDLAPELAKETIYIAGDRVVSDPLAVPFSIGLNLLCIYSKKYFTIHPEERESKQLHNKRAMQQLSEVLKEGGRSVFLAPSGGRDRKNDQGELEVHPFDQQSIEMFRLTAKKSGVKTHFFPLMLKTHCIMPPPESIQVELGETRHTEGGAIHATFCDEVDMDQFEKAGIKDKHEIRRLRAEEFWQQVAKAHNSTPN